MKEHTLLTHEQRSTNELIERQYLNRMGKYIKLFLKLKLLLHKIKSCEIMQNCPLTESCNVANDGTCFSIIQVQSAAIKKMCTNAFLHIQVMHHDHANSELFKLKFSILICIWSSKLSSWNKYRGIDNSRTKIKLEFCGTIAPLSLALHKFCWKFCQE